MYVMLDREEVTIGLDTVTVYNIKIAALWGGV